MAKPMSDSDLLTYVVALLGACLLTKFALMLFPSLAGLSNMEVLIVMLSFVALISSLCIILTWMQTLLCRKPPPTPGRHARAVRATTRAAWIETLTATDLATELALARAYEEPYFFSGKVDDRPCYEGKLDDQPYYEGKTDDHRRDDAIPLLE